MSNTALHTKIESLPEDLQQQVLEYIEFLLSREAKQLKPKQQAEIPPSLPSHAPSAAPLDGGQVDKPNEQVNYDTDITPEQLAIIRRRMAEIESGAVQSISGNVVKNKLIFKYGLQD